MTYAKTPQNPDYRILLIEDSKLDQIAFTRSVKSQNLPYDCTIADSVSQAKNILASQHFDVVIADYLLEDGTAFDIFDSVKNIPVIFVTGAGNEEVAIKASRTGAYDYLIKDDKQNYLKTLPITVENAIRYKKTEKILQQKQKNIEAIFDAVPVGMLLVDENMIVKRVNDAIKQMVGKEYSQIINQKIGGALGCVNSTYSEKGCTCSPSCTTCQFRQAIETVLDSGLSVNKVEFQHTLKNDDSEIRPWLSINAGPVTIDGVKHVVIAIDDISERKKAQEKLRETMEIKSQFISTVSHELRTPLGALKESVNIVADGVVGRINKKQRDFLDIAKRNADRLALLINDVLDFQKLEAGRMRLNTRPNDIKEVVEDVYRTMVISAKKKDVHLSLEVDGNLPKVSFDSDKMIQVLTNLVGNAIKFTPEQGRISVCAQQQNKELVIRVSDTGMGIPKNELPKIFKRFYRVHRPGKQIQGTGLGLAIVNKIVILHHGRIEVESQLNQGTTFTVFLPLDAKNIPQALPAITDQILENAVTDV